MLQLLNFLELSEHQHRSGSKKYLSSVKLGHKKTKREADVLYNV